MKIDHNDFKDRNYNDLIFESLHWTIFLAPNQSNIGTCLIALKRRCGTLDGLNDEEWLDFGKVVRKVEYSIRNSFKSVMFNWGSLMNADYLIENPDPHVHWHLIPRYMEKIEF
jgi:diadenosine tetraphosphate (Ap4A) HIT family hydrolase